VSNIIEICITLEINVSLHPLQLAPNYFIKYIPTTTFIPFINFFPRSFSRIYFLCGHHLWMVVGGEGEKFPVLVEVVYVEEACYPSAVSLMNPRLGLSCVLSTLSLYNMAWTMPTSQENMSAKARPFLKIQRIHN